MKTFVLSLLLALCATFALAADLSGKWSGTFIPEGQEPQQAFLILKQSGGALTGSGGPSEEEQWPLENGKLDGAKLTGQVKAPDGAVYSLDLTLTGDHLKGEVTATHDGETMKGKLDLARAK